MTDKAKLQQQIEEMRATLKEMETGLEHEYRTTKATVAVVLLAVIVGPYFLERAWLAGGIAAVLLGLVVWLLWFATRPLVAVEDDTIHGGGDDEAGC
jgi:hypothetical protein